MLGKIGPVMPAGIEMKFMRNFLSDQKIVERLRSAVESEQILRSAIEVNRHPRRMRALFHQGEWVIAVPERPVEGRPEGPTHHSREAFTLRIGCLHRR